MVRQHTLLHQRILPQSPCCHKPQRLNHRPAQPIKSRLAARPPLTRNSRASAWGNNRRIHLSRSTLPTIQEEDEEGYQAQSNFDPNRELDAYEREEKRVAHEEDEEMMEWDEESTLVALFQDDFTEAVGDQDFAALVDKLKGPMSAQSQQLKQYTADTVLPVIKRVKEVHDTLEDEVDMAFGTGLLTFDEVCKRVEMMALRNEDETKTAYLDSQKAVSLLMGELVEAYQHRAQLWVDLEEKLENCAERAKTALEAIPGEVEDTITRLEKKCKDMEKNSNSAASKQKMLRGLLERL